MVLVATREQGRSSRRRIDLPGLFSYYKSEWLHTEPAGASTSPLVYLVEQAPGSALPTHFHRQNQFQVFVEGDGKFGPHEIAPGMVHYANAYTGYGPIVSGGEGLRYFTFRAQFDSGAFMLDSQRNAMVRGPKRNLHAQCPGSWETGEQGRRSELVRVALFPAQPDELQAERLRLPPGRGLACPLSEGLGTFYFVLHGGVRHAGGELGLHESLYLPPGEHGVVLTAASRGAAILRLQVPRLAPEYLP